MLTTKRQTEIHPSRTTGRSVAAFILLCSALTVSCTPTGHFKAPYVMGEPEHAYYYFRSDSYDPDKYHGDMDIEEMIPQRYLKYFFRVNKDGSLIQRLPMAGNYTIWFYDPPKYICAVAGQNGYRVYEMTEEGLHFWDRTEKYDGMGNLTRIDYGGTLYEGSDNYIEGDGLYQVFGQYRTDLLVPYSGDTGDYSDMNFRGEDERNLFKACHISKWDDEHIHIHREGAYVKERGWIVKNRKRGQWYYYDDNGELSHTKRHRMRKKEDVRFPHRYLR